jgi:prephenate dehydrogenase
MKPIRQITIVGTGLIGGSFGLAMKHRGFSGSIIGCDRAPVLARAREKGAIDQGEPHLSAAIRGSHVVLLATPVGAIIDLIERVGPVLAPGTLLTDVGSTKAQVVARASQVFGRNAPRRFLSGHPMAGKEQAGVEFADPHLFEGAVWFVTPIAEQDVFSGLSGDFLALVEKFGARVARIDAAEHDKLCAWISHLPQMVSTALAATLVEEFGKEAPLLETGGRALREMTRVAASPYSMWRDIALTNKDNLQEALLRLEQHLAHIRENLGTRELEKEFECAHELRKKYQSTSVAALPKTPGNS